MSKEEKRLPLLETRRLILRAPEKADAPAFLALWRQEFVRRYNVFGKLPSLEEAEDILTQNPGGQLALVQKDGGVVVGRVGIESDRLRFRVKSFSLDYYLGEAWARQGYMTEALERVLDYLFAQRGAELVSARAFTENAASLGILEKLGFTREGTLRRGVRTYEDKCFDDALFSLLREEWALRRPESFPKLGDRVAIKIDRPLGTAHPRHPDIVYSVNYGYVPGVIAPDGAEQDAYVLGVDVPLETFTGRLIAVIHRLDDVEEKWVLAPEGMCFTKEEIKSAVWFVEQYYHIEIRM